MQQGISKSSLETKIMAQIARFSIILKTILLNNYDFTF